MVTPGGEVSCVTCSQKVYITDCDAGQPFLLLRHHWQQGSEFMFNEDGIHRCSVKGRLFH